MHNNPKKMKYLVDTCKGSFYFKTFDAACNKLFKQPASIYEFDFRKKEWRHMCTHGNLSPQINQE